MHAPAVIQQDCAFHGSSSPSLPLPGPLDLDLDLSLFLSLLSPLLSHTPLSLPPLLPSPFSLKLDRATIGYLGYVQFKLQLLLSSLKLTRAHLFGLPWPESLLHSMILDVVLLVSGCVPVSIVATLGCSVMH